MISTAIQQLVNYGLDTGLILPDDEIYIRNQLLMTMQLDDFTAPEGEVCYTDLESILKTLVDDAAARGVCEDNSTARDLFDLSLIHILQAQPGCEKPCISNNRRRPWKVPLLCQSYR